jgi:hypothetical protein
MSDKKVIQVDVTIMGQAYKLSCKEGEDRALRKRLLISTQRCARFVILPASKEPTGSQ